MVSEISYLNRSSSFKVCLYTQPYTWSVDDEVDVTDDVLDCVLTETINTYHTAQLILNNHKRQYSDTSSDFYLFKKMRFRVTLGDKSFKMIVRRPPQRIKNDRIEVQLVSHTYDLVSAIAQIRVQPSEDGTYYLEDVLYSALYDTGMQNFFIIKLQDGSYYNQRSSTEYKNKMESIDDVVYIRQPVIDIINDICTKSNCIWVEEDLPGTNETLLKQYSVLNFIPIETDYDVPVDKIISLSTRNDTIDLHPLKDFDTVSNVIYFDELPIFIREDESIDEYGDRNPLKITFPDDGDAKKFVDIAFGLRSVVKDPITTVTVNVKKLANIDSMDKFIKITDNDGNYDNSVGINRKYRIHKVKYDIINHTTSIEAGNVMRDKVKERLIDLTRSDADSEDANDSRVVGKQETIKLQVYTEHLYHSYSLTETTTDFGIRLGIDYLYDSTLSPNSKLYMDDDDVRTGN